MRGACKAEGSSLVSDAARSLHTLIAALNDSEGAHPFARWEQVLDAQQATPEFAERHAAVVMLWRETVASIRALAGSSTRERRLAYATTWWRALVLPDRNWSEQKNIPFLDQASLDILDVTAEHLGELDGRWLSQDVDSALNSLRTAAEGWVSVVGEDEALPRSLRVALGERLESLIWFIDHADRFGVASVVRSGETASGALLRAAVDHQRMTWTQRLVGLVGAITLVSTGLNQSSAAIDYGQEIYREIEAGVTGQPDPDHQGGSSSGDSE